MRSATILAAGFAAVVQAANTSASVSGTAEGFAASVTGGGDAAAVTPTTTDELVSYLTDSEARVIVLTKTFDFTGLEGTTTGTGCAPWGTATACQQAINKDDWCTNYEPDAPTVDVTYDNAGLNPIKVASDKTILGQGTSGVIKGKGLYLANVENVIIQNIRITELNPQYVWGGDAITLAGTDLVWIDHVTTDQIGRQHIVLGEAASGRVTISNSHIDGESTYSATCDGYHYWNLYFTGSDDQITLKNNYIHHFSGRAPKLGGSTVLHAVNNYWYESSGHGFEVGEGAYVLAEGNVFGDVATIYEDGDATTVYTVNDATGEAACSSNLGRDCVSNSFSNSGTFSFSDTSVLSKFSSADSIAAAAAVSSVTGVSSSAGYGTI
ncbi:putative pectin lyase A [Cytospora mali]|uniref:pectin lyase n=1 Tax=Cytospora mali TaxID=578113 RepID=A0A194UST7_CYTMA|nr:putative pectin lyase A [Valsa mali var. pyri (nom. inval.)]